MFCSGILYIFLMYHLSSNQSTCNLLIDLAMCSSNHFDDTVYIIYDCGLTSGNDETLQYTVNIDTTFRIIVCIVHGFNASGDDSTIYNPFKALEEEFMRGILSNHIVEYDFVSVLRRLKTSTNMMEKLEEITKAVSNHYSRIQNNNLLDGYTQGLSSLLIELQKYNFYHSNPFIFAKEIAYIDRIVKEIGHVKRRSDCTGNGGSNVKSNYESGKRRKVCNDDVETEP